ncbi:Glutaredoxin [Pseudomonas peli]|jgi:mycoredoxin|uniref:Glutaredoxin n=2 Tax=Pseudomonas TaxID=286 RepID=A0AB37Z4A1_9PSED|nr:MULTISPECIES: glutaredoxin domain-containing protein [Pseudomonas]MDR7023184.1 glutaredoxin [Pseudomonas peli]NMZ68789.1 glutaredoxin family protein [Pseudomonas peli]SCW40038.1 Glutaredoxin [Pseudomonas peli]SEC26956.1 Glutaredoxin [Pseudomonas anguilliseptica]
MKKVILLLSALALFQHWDTVQRWFQPPLADRPGEVVLYATQWCGYCAKTREQLAQDQIAYREIDIEKDPAGQATFKALGGRGVPLLDIKGTLIHGYDPQAMRAAY